MKYIKVSTNGSYFLFMTLLYVVSPLAAFVVALALYKKTVSQFFFIAFAFYFGYQLGPNLDLEMHWRNFQSIQGMSFFEMYSDYATLYIGQEPYHIIFKYLISEFQASERVFGGAACALYALSFILFIRQFKELYSQKMLTIQLLVFLTIVVIVEFFWYVGLRFWTGVFVFMIFYCRYILTGRKLFLALTLTCLLFHVALATLFLAAVFVEFTNKYKVVQYVVLGVSFVFRFVYFGFDKLMSNIPLVQMFYKSNYNKDFYQKIIADKFKKNHEEGNIIYTNRIAFMLIIFFIIIYALWRRNKNLHKDYPKMFGMVLILLAISNFGYTDYVFYDRFIKITTLVAYSYLFIVLFNDRNLWLNKSFFTKLVLMAIVCGSLLIALVQFRHLVMDINLWFGNYWSYIPLQEIENGTMFK